MEHLLCDKAPHIPRCGPCSQQPQDTGRDPRAQKPSPCFSCPLLGGRACPLPQYSAEGEPTRGLLCASHCAKVLRGSTPLTPPTIVGEVVAFTVISILKSLRHRRAEPCAQRRPGKRQGGGLSQAVWLEPLLLPTASSPCPASVPSAGHFVRNPALPLCPAPQGKSWCDEATLGCAADEGVTG